MSNKSPQSDNNFINNGSVSFENETISEENYEWHSLQNEIDKTDDLDVLDELFNKLQAKFAHKSQLLKNIQQMNNASRDELNSSKYLLSELEQIQNEKHQRMKNVREFSEEKQLELERLHKQQIDDLVSFENFVKNITEIFKNAPKEYDSNILMNKAMEIQEDLDQKKIELNKRKQDLQAAQDKCKETYVDDSFQVLAMKTLERHVDYNSSGNDQLRNSLEELTRKLNSLHFEIPNLNNYKI